MDNYLLKSISPQAARVYHLLEDKHPRSAKEIGRHLKILPNAVYRSVKQLLDLGFVEKTRQYPVKFQAKPPDETLELYLSIIRQNFNEMFIHKRPKFLRRYLMRLAFIHSRKDLHKFTAKDIPQTNKTINLIASGFEVPAGIVLAYKQAIDRGVRVRIIVQNLNKVLMKKFHLWKKAGVEVKYYPTLESRIFVFDHKVVYFTSYNAANLKEATGIRFDYAPFARLMDELFEQRWALAKEISQVLS